MRGDFPGGPVVKTSPSNAVGVGLIPGPEAQTSWPKKQNAKQKQYCNKFSKDFKNGSHPPKKKAMKEFSGSPMLGLSTLVAKGPGLIPGQGTRIPQATRHGQKIK